MSNKRNLKKMIGKTPVHIHTDSDSLIFTMQDGTVFELYHAQNCCESVEIESIAGDIDAMIGHPIAVAEERSSERNSATEAWTFYTFRSHGGTLDVRWYGKSSGYYSLEVTVATYKAKDAPVDYNHYIADEL